MPKGSSKRTTLLERLLAHAKPEGDCIVWTSKRDARGYGRVRWRGRTRRAHRVLYEVEFGPIAEGLVVCHVCDNPPCIKPTHLFVGTQADNIADMVRKGRLGPRSPKRKLTADLVLLIRKWVAGGASLRQLSKSLGIHHTTIGSAARRETWRHLP